MLLAHKIELRPTPEQEQFLFQSVGVRRFTYNALLAHFKQDGVKWNKKAANDKLKDLKSEHLWMQEVSARTSRNVIDDLDNAFKRFFKNVKAGKKPGFPKFKKKGVSDSFSIREQPKFDVNGRMLRIEKLKTKIKMRQRLRLNGTAKQCTVSFSGGRWFASILVDCIESPWNPIDTNTRKPSVGVDIGIKSLAVLSDGTEIPASQPLKRLLKKLAKLQKRFARQKKGSNRRAITKRKISRLHFFVAQKRKAVLHELTDYLTRNHDRIVIEDLNVSGMVKNRKLARSISDVGFGEFRRQLEYKAFFRGCELVVADMFFPSSKMCSGCGVVHDMPLGNREMNCDCGTVLDRDHNAAINLMNYVPTRSSGTKSTQEFSKSATAAA
jgi:putative transposase